MTYDEERGVLNALIFDKSENTSMQVSLIRYYTLHFNLEAKKFDSYGPQTYRVQSEITSLERHTD